MDRVRLAVDLCGNLQGPLGVWVAGFASEKTPWEFVGIPMGVLFRKYMHLFKAFHGLGLFRFVLGGDDLDMRSEEK